MNKQEQVQQMTTYMANFVSHIAKVLPDDIIKKLDELGAQEDAPLSKVIYETMKRNQKLAKELNRPEMSDDTPLTGFDAWCARQLSTIHYFDAIENTLNNEQK